MFGFSIKKIAFYAGLVLAGIVAGVVLTESQALRNEAISQIPTTESPPQEIPATQETDDTALVIRVIDGDTVELENGQRVRYIGIETPEIVDPRKPVQCFGTEAKSRNEQLVGGQRVRLEKDVSETDRYGRLLRYVYAGDIFVNLMLVQEGYAYSVTYPPDVKYQKQFTDAERIAREQKRGLWSSCPTAASSEKITTSTSSPTQTSLSCGIKGNISSSGEKIYHLVGCGSYNQTKIDEVRGERWFCAEGEATEAGWRKAKNCP